MHLQPIAHSSEAPDSRRTANRATRACPQPPPAEWKPWEVPEGYKVEMLEEHQVESKVGGGSATQAPQPK